MAGRFKKGAFGRLFIALFAICATLLASSVAAAPYAAMVMDARTGEVLHSRNADTRLHPASLTKMMTLYIAFQAIERGEITLDTEVRISRLAASEPPSKLGLRSGQTIRLRYLIRAAALKSANDASTAIAEAISGSESAFATRMNRTARAMGMRNTSFRNAHGLTQSGHLSTARDMSILGRHVIYDFPQYYNLFSRRTASAGISTVRHTNRRWLDSYAGGDGIKTGYTRAAGYNLVASAERGQERIIATVFGGSSTTARNARITELMNMGFNRAPSRATLRRPTPPGAMLSDGDGIGRTTRANGLLARSLRPVARPETRQTPAPSETVMLARVDTDAINAAVAQSVDSTLAAVLAGEPQSPEQTPLASSVMPVARPVAPQTTEIVTRISTSGGRHWGVNIGRYPSRYDAERVLLQVALRETSALDGALRRVVHRPGGFDANFMGLSREGADLACRRLQARGTPCYTIGTGG